MASQPTIAIQIRTALAQYLKRDTESVRPTDRLREDLGLDSLAMIELLFRIEEHFDLEIPNEDLSRVTTVADVTAYVEEKLAALPVRPPAPGAGRPAPAPAIGAKPVPPGPAIAPKPGPALASKPAAASPARAAKAPAPAKRAPAKVTSIKAAAKRRSTRPAAKGSSAKKKGSRRA